MAVIITRQKQKVARNFIKIKTLGKFGHTDVAPAIQEGLTLPLPTVRTDILNYDTS